MKNKFLLVVLFLSASLIFSDGLAGKKYKADVPILFFSQDAEVVIEFFDDGTCKMTSTDKETNKTYEHLEIYTLEGAKLKIADSSGAYSSSTDSFSIQEFAGVIFKRVK